MNVRTGLSLAIIGICAAFALVNWKTISTPTSIDFLFAAVQAPLGIIFLLFLGTVVVAYIVLGAFMEAKALREARATAKEIERLRRLLDHAQESAIAELRADLVRELNRINEKLDRLRAG